MQLNCILKKIKGEVFTSPLINPTVNDGYIFFDLLGKFELPFKLNHLTKKL